MDAKNNGHGDTRIWRDLVLTAAALACGAKLKRTITEPSGRVFFELEGIPPHWSWRLKKNEIQVQLLDLVEGIKFLKGLIYAEKHSMSNNDEPQRREISHAEQSTHQ